MRLTIIARVAVLALGLAIGIPTNATAQTTLWCEDTERIEIENCLEEKPEQGLFLPVLLEENCIGEVGVEEGSPLCSVTRMVDFLGQPITVECEITMESEDHEVHITTRFKNGELPVPEWSSPLFIECEQMADARIDGVNPPSKVQLIPGSTIIVQTTLDRFDGTKIPEEFTLELKRIQSEDKIQEDLVPGLEANLGSFPVGVYDLQIAGDGIASIVDWVQIEASADPVVLTYDLESDRCVTVPILCFGCRNLVLHHRLDQTQSPMRPVIHSEGPLPLEKVGPDHFVARLCGLPSNPYVLTVEAAAYQPFSVGFTLSDSDLALDQVELRDGVAGKLYVYDEVGLPIVGADTTVVWRSGDQGTHVSVVTDSQGLALLPPLDINTPMDLWIAKEGFVSQNMRAYAGSDVFISLAETGRVTGQVEAEACDEGTVVVEVKPCRGSSCRKMSPMALMALPDCTIDFPIREPGHYQVSVTAPDTAAFVEDLDLNEHLSHDFGTITLEPGAELTVAVYHREDPVPGATVTLVGRCPSKMTDGSGGVTFSCLEEDAEDVEIRVQHPEYALARLTAEILTSDQEVRVDLVKGARIHGRVFNDDGSPASGAELHARGEGDRRTARIGPDGRYAFDMIPPGTWRLFVLQGSRNVMQTGGSRKVQVEDGADLEVNFLPEVDVTGRALLDGIPIENSILAAITTSANGGSGARIGGIEVGPGSVFTALFPAEGLWTFRSPRSRGTVTVLLESCPCAIELDFTSSAPEKP